MRAEYLQLLEEYGLSENDVDPMIRWQYWSEEQKVKFLSAKDRVRPDFFNLYDDLRRVVLSRSPFGTLDFWLGMSKRDKEYKNLQEMESGNANMLIGLISGRLKQRLIRRGLPTPNSQVFHGVFPTRCFNAQVARRGNGFLVLVESAAIGVAEVAASLATYQSIPRETASEHLARVCEAYVKQISLPLKQRYQAPHVEKYDLEYGPSEDDYQSSVNLTTAVEEFAIAHEWGHLVLGHALGKTVCALPEWREDNVAFEESFRHDEFMADIWATSMLMKSAPREKKEVTLAGALLFLRLAEQIEDYADIQDRQLLSHPSASCRIWMVNRVASQYGLFPAKKGISYQIESLFDPAQQRFGKNTSDAGSSDKELGRLYEEAINYLFPYKDRDYTW